MTERWERELSKLRAEEPPGEVWERVRRGPSGDAPPPRRERLVAGVVALAVFAAAGGFAWNALRPAGTGQPPRPKTSPTSHGATLLVVGGRSPSAALSLGGATQTGARGSYCWTSESSGVCGDAVPFGEPDRWLDLPLGESVVLGGDASSIQLTLTRANGGQNRPVETGSLRPGDRFPLPGEEGAAGRYALVAFGRWPQGDAEFQFGIHLEAPPGERGARDVAHVTCTPTGARTSTPVVSAQTNGVHIEVTNASNATRFEVHAEGWNRVKGIGRKLGRRARTVWQSVPPGSVSVTCLDENGASGFPVRFEVVDPAGYWTPLARLTCDGPTTSGRVALSTDVPLDDPVEAERVLAPYVHGMELGDQFGVPGYPAQGFKVPTFVILRDGRVIARLFILRGLHLDTCLGSGLDVARTPEEALACPIADRVDVAPSGNAVATPGGAAFISVNLSGILRSDEVVQVTSQPNGSTEWSGTWDVVRDDLVLAVIDFDTLHGVACVGSGIGGA